MRIAAGAGLVLALALVVGQMSGNQPERDSVAAASRELGIAFEASRVDVGELSLHVVQAGPRSGPPVLLLHGFPEFWYAWRGPMAELARAGFRVIAPDQRGYNLSDKPAGVAPYRIDRLVGDVLGLIDALGYEQVFLAAQDWGGAVTWRTLIEHPERIRRFAVLDTAHPFAFRDFESSEDTVSWYRTFIQIPWLPGFSARIANWWLLANNMRTTSSPGAFPDAALDQYRSAWDRDGAIHHMAAWYRAEAVPIEGDARVALSTLVIAAENDAFIAGDLTRRSLDYLDHGRLLELGSGTHWAAQDEPARIGRILVDFFSEGS